MQIVTTIYLTEEEVERVEFRTRLIDDRLQQKYDGKHQRWDMYWVECTLLDARYRGDTADLGSACIDSDLQRPMLFTVECNSCYNIDHESWKKLRVRIADWFREQPEYPQQVRWAEQIRDKYQILYKI